MRKVTTFPLTLQFPFWTTVKVTGRPELAVALTVKLVPIFWDGMELKVMVWDMTCALTTTICPTCAAAA